MDKKYKSLIFPIIVIIASTSIALFEAIIFYKYQISNKYKTNYEQAACNFTIMKSILNILYSTYILRTDVLKKKENKAWDILKMIIFGVNIWGIILYSNLKECGMFIPVIIIEFIIFVFVLSLIGILLLIVFCIFINGTEQKNIIVIDNTPVIIIDIPQIAIPTKLDIANIYIPQATLVK